MMVGWGGLTMAPLFYSKRLAMPKGPSKEELLRMITEAATPAAASFGLEIWGIELIGSGRFLARIFVNAPLADTLQPPFTEDATEDRRSVPAEGVTIDQCAEISRMVGLALDVEDVFSDAWVLEVSSPGLERTFFRPEQMKPYVGRDVDVLLWEPHCDAPRRRKFYGKLLHVDKNAFILRLDAAGPDGTPTEMDFIWPEVRRARLIHTFPDTSKPIPGKRTGKGGGKKI
jgi:ribosome maturation factor RimP